MRKAPEAGPFFLSLLGSSSLAGSASKQPRCRPNVSGRFRPRCVEGCTRLVAMLLPEVLRISRLPSGEAVAGEIGTPADVAEITRSEARRVGNVGATHV